MNDPYRDSSIECPACKMALRAFRERLCCDGCGGIFIGLDDLVAEIGALTSITPEISFTEERAGTRCCPRCVVTMDTCKLDARLIDTHVTTKPILDRCKRHGLWFDRDELEKVEERIEKQADREWRKRAGLGKWAQRLFGL
jgi:hypothetical protein